MFSRIRSWGDSKRLAFMRWAHRAAFAAMTAVYALWKEQPDIVKQLVHAPWWAAIPGGILFYLVIDRVGKPNPS